MEVSRKKKNEKYPDFIIKNEAEDNELWSADLESITEVHHGT